MKRRIADLTGPDLDLAAAVAEDCAMTEDMEAMWIAAARLGPPVIFRFDGGRLCVAGLAEDDTRWAPSTDPRQGMPILERERIAVIPLLTGGWTGWATRSAHVEAEGPTMLIAGLRAYLAGKYGDEVELPGGV